MARRPPDGERFTPDRLVAVGVERDAGLAVVRVRGELDMALAPRLARAIERLQASSLPEIVIDLTDVSFVDSAGMSVLVRATKDLSATGTALRVRGTSPAVLRRLSLTGLDSVLSFEGRAT